MKKELSDRELIKSWVAGNSTAANDLYRKYKKRAFSIAYKYTKNVEDSNELVQDSFLKAFKSPDRLKGINNFSAWIAKVVENKGLDYSRKKTKENKIDGSFLMDKERYPDPEKEVLETEYEKMSAIEKLKNSSPQFLNELKRSLDYILHLYWLKEEYDCGEKNVLPFLKTRAILAEAKKEIENIFEPPSSVEVKKTFKILKPKFSMEFASRIEKIIKNLGENDHLIKLEFIRRHFAGSDQYPDELNEINKQLFLKEDNREFFDLFSAYLAELIKKVDDKIRRSTSLSWFLLPDDFKGLLKDVDKINIDPPGLIFRVWTKAFRRNQKTNLKFIGSLLPEFKAVFRKTLWAPLFASLNESFNIETWRKKTYQKTPGNRLYDQLADLIYQKSFVEKISIYPWR